jgi:hypothetical protein
MRILKKILFWLVGLVVAVASVILGLQVFYKLTPVALSPEAVALNERASKLPVVTENGYRAYGLLAPKDVDPVTYGRCRVDAQNLQREERRAWSSASPPAKEKAAYDAHWKAFNDRVDLAEAPCLHGGTRVSLPKQLLDMHIKPGIPAARWQTLAAITPDPVIVARAEAVWAGDARRLGVDVDSPIAEFQNLIKLERWRTAGSIQTWDSRNRAQAVASWTRSIDDWVKSADDSLIDAMISTAALSQVMIAMQDAVARSERIDDATAEAALAALAPIENMPQAITDSMLTEWLLTSRTMKSLPDTKSPLYVPGQGDSGLLMRTVERGATLTFDVNDTLNRLAVVNLQSQRTVMSAARGEPETPIKWEGMTTACGSLGDWEFFCLPFVRNPIGRILVAISAPLYRDYGVRIADLRNLAAATRLTMEARRRGLAGDALATFVAAAPADMRDVFSKQPFTYDPATNRLRIGLRQRSTVLGDKSYELAL